MKTKNEIRQELKAAIGELPSGEKRQQSTRLCGRLLQHPGIQAVKTLGIYLPLPDEPDLRPALHTLMRRGVRLALPFPDENNHWHFHRVSRLETTTPGVWGLDFPEKEAQIQVAELNIILVPGRGFTPQGQRIGRGKGYYDRLLQDHQGQRIGIGFSCQLCEALPEEAHDIRLTDIWIAPAGTTAESPQL